MSLRSSVITSVHAGSGEPGYRPAVDLHRLDAISNEVCAVIDLCELVRNVHAGKEWRDGAEDAFGVLFGFISQLNTDRELYEAVAELERLGEGVFDYEESRMVSLLRREVRRRDEEVSRRAVRARLSDRGVERHRAGLHGSEWRNDSLQ